MKGSRKAVLCFWEGSDDFGESTLPVCLQSQTPGISQAVPLSSRKNAKGGEQGTQLACGSNKCPLPSNAFSRKPRGSHAPEIRHPGQEMVLRWGMEGARGKGRDPAMGSEKNGQLCRKCGKVCYDENGRIQ